MRVQRASYQVNTAKLSSEFGKAMAARWFTDEQLSHWPRLKAGKFKGELAGIIEWKKVTVGGWQRGVLTPGTRDVTLVCTVREFGMSREKRMPSRGKVEDQLAADKLQAENVARLRAEIEAVINPTV